MFLDLPRTGCGQLGSWEAWTRCSVSCGHGLKFRVRRCQKVEETDKDCNAELSEDQTCNQPICTGKHVKMTSSPVSPAGIAQW